MEGAAKILHQRIRQIVLAIPVAILSAAGCVLQWKIHPEISFIICLAVSLMLRHFVIHHGVSKRVQRWSIVLGFVFAVFMVVGREIHLNATIEGLIDLKKIPQAFIRIVGLALLCGEALCIVYGIAVKQQKRGNQFSPPFVGLWVAIFACWIPYLVIFYPGCTSYDSMIEIKAMLGEMPLSNHHPIIHQWTIAPFLLIGQAVDSIEIGIMLYHLFQMAVMSAIFAAALYELAQCGTALWLRSAFFVWYALHTVNAFYSITMWKDVIFGGITLLLIIQLIRLCEQTEKKGFGPWLMLGVTLFLFCLYRNNGYYAFLFGIPFFILSNRRKYKQLLAIGLAVFVAVNAYQMFIFNVLGVQKSKIGESLSVPLQQVARVIRYYHSNLTEEEIDALEEIFPSIEEVSNSYAPHISDPVKELFRSEVFNENPQKYIKVWLELGLRHPLVYLDAFLYQGHGYWYPNTPYWTVLYFSAENNFDMKIEATEAVKTLRSLHDRLEVHPIIGWLYRPATYVWLVLIACGLLLCKRRALLLTPMLFLLGLWLTTLLSPVFAEYRYLYGVSVCAPYLLGVAQAAESRS